jgi:hypothetical protein
VPPNPRDHLRPGDEVPQQRVANVIADALAVEFPGHPDLRDRLGALVVERLDYFRLLAPDVEIRHCQPGHDRHVQPPWPHVGCILR